LTKQRITHIISGSAGGNAEQRPGALGGAFRRAAQRVVGERARGEHNDADAGLEERYDVLLHRGMRGGLDDHFWPLREQRVAADDVSEPVARSERPAGRGVPAPGERDELDAGQLVAVLQQQAGDGAAAQDGHAHGALRYHCLRRRRGSCVSRF